MPARQAASDALEANEGHATPYNLRSSRKPNARNTQVAPVGGTPVKVAGGGKKGRTKTRKITQKPPRNVPKGPKPGKKKAAKRAKSVTPSESESESDEYTPRDPTDYHDPPDSENEGNRKEPSLSRLTSLPSSPEKEDPQDGEGVGHGGEEVEGVQRDGGEEQGVQGHEGAGEVDEGKLGRQLVQQFMEDSDEDEALGRESTRFIRKGGGGGPLQVGGEASDWTGFPDDDDDPSDKEDNVNKAAEDTFPTVKKILGQMNSQSEGRPSQPEAGLSPIVSPGSRLSILSPTTRGIPQPSPVPQVSKRTSSKSRSPHKSTAETRQPPGHAANPAGDVFYTGEATISSKKRGRPPSPLKPSKRVAVNANTSQASASASGRAPASSRAHKEPSSPSKSSRKRERSSSPIKQRKEQAVLNAPSPQYQSHAGRRAPQGNNENIRSQESQRGIPAEYSVPQEEMKRQLESFRARKGIHVDLAAKKNKRIKQSGATSRSTQNGRGIATQESDEHVEEEDERDDADAGTGEVVEAGEESEDGEERSRAREGMEEMDIDNEMEQQDDADESQHYEAGHSMSNNVSVLTQRRTTKAKHKAPDPKVLASHKVVLGNDHNIHNGGKASQRKEQQLTGPADSAQSNFSQIYGRNGWHSTASQPKPTKSALRNPSGGGARGRGTEIPAEARPPSDSANQPRAPSSGNTKSNPTPSAPVPRVGHSSHSKENVVPPNSQPRTLEESNIAIEEFNHNRRRKAAPKSAEEKRNRAIQKLLLPAGDVRGNAREEEGEYFDLDGEEGQVAELVDNPTQALVKPDQMGYYSGGAKDLVRESCDRMRFFLFTKRPYAPVHTLLEKGQKFYVNASQDAFGSRYKEIAPPYTAGIQKLLKEQSWKLRRRMKVIAEKLVDRYYGLHPPPELLARCHNSEEMEKASQQYTMKRVAYLLGEKNRYLCAPAESDEQLIPYSHIAIKKLILDLLFNPKSRPRPLAMIAIDELDPIPIECIAYAATAIRCALEEYKDTGVLVDIEFSENEYQKYYNKLFNSLAAWRERSTGYLYRMCHDIFTAGKARLRNDSTDDSRPDAPVILHDPPDYA